MSDSTLRTEPGGGDLPRVEPREATEGGVPTPSEEYTVQEVAVAQVAAPPGPGEPPGPGATLAGRYTVLGSLGEGGMGVVLSAYDSRLDRRVALKLLRSQLTPATGSESGGMQMRLVREAQAMARLNHPNVVAVYDAGPLEGGSLYLAMEYVEGETLKVWCQQPRPWREVLSAYLAAGRGLAAAHAAGLVHRDFKPENVLVGKDGRVRVTDFGVARSEALPAPSTPVPAPLHISAEAWQQSLTLPGFIVGTPRYMAPELFKGQPAGPRSDLYSFCVALYETLYKQPAFGGSNRNERLQAQLKGEVSAPPSKTEVPGWVTRAVMEGLSADPALRPPSMEVLLARLEDDPAVKRRARLRAAVLVCVGGALAGLVAWGWVRQQGPGCGGMERRLAGVWDEQVRGQVRQALLATRLAYAPDTAERVEALLDRYAGQWAELSQQVCEAAVGPVGGGRSLRVLQESCLERRKSQLGAVTGLLGQGPDPELLSKAVQTVSALPPVSYCADENALTAAVPPPEDPQLRAKVDALQPELDRLEALFEAGKYKEGLEEGERVLEQVLTVDFVPLKARALYQVASLQQMAGDLQGAEARLREAILLAAEGRDSVLLARAWSLTLMVVGVKRGRLQEAEGLELTVQAAVAQAGDDQARAEALSSLGALRYSLGKHAEALEHYTRAQSLLQKVLGPEHPRLFNLLNHQTLALGRLGKHAEALALNEHVVALSQKVLGKEHPSVVFALKNLAALHSDMGRYEQALATYEQAYVLLKKTLGPEHPSAGELLNNKSTLLSDLGRYEEALANYEQVQALLEKSLGPEHPKMIILLNNQANALFSLGRYEESQARYERVLGLWPKVLGPEHPDMATPLSNLAEVLRYMGKYKESQAYYERAQALLEKALGKDHSELSYVHEGLGRLHVLRKAWRQAEYHLQRAKALREEALGKDHPELASLLLGLGELNLGRRQPDKAVPLLERALESTQGDKAEVQLSLAQALWDSRGDKRRAVELARSARERWQHLGHPAQAKASRWLSAHPLR